MVKSIDENLLLKLTEELLLRLLEEGESKVSEAKANEAESLVKILNSAMLRLLENANPDNLYSVLFDILIKYRK